MDERLLITFNRQLRIIKWMLGFFFVMFVAMLAILGFIAYKVVTFTQDVNDRIDDIQTKTTQALDLRSKVCDNKTLSGILGSGNDVCN